MRVRSLMKPALIALTALLAVLAVCGCSRDATRDGKPVVFVSVVPLAYPVRSIAGELVDVEVMIPPGANEATHEPTIGQLQALSRASVYIKVGHPAFVYEQTWIEKLLADYPGIDVVNPSVGLETDAEDPHVWVSPKRMRQMVEPIHAALVRLLPAEKARLDEGLRRLQAEIDDVDAELTRTLTPVRGKRFFVFHPAWGYLARDYGLVQVAIEEHGREPDAKALARTIDQARAARVRVIFIQPQFSEASAELVAAEVGARIEAIDPLSPDWADNLRKVGRELAEQAVP